MQYASEEYKREMQKALRNQSFVWVNLGVINQQAQSVASVRSAQAEFSNPTSVTDSNSKVVGYYATMEQNQFRVDGDMYFQPEEQSGEYLFNQGVVSDKALGEIKFVFPNLTEVNIKGLTIDFGEYYPLEFDVTNGKTTHTYGMKAPGKFVTEDTFNDGSYIRIIPYRMVGGTQRFRIASILFGVGLQFTNRELISTTRTNKVDHISSQLPQKSFTFTVDNTILQLNKDNPDSYANYLEEKQVCEFEYGRLLDNGTIEHIKGGKTLLKTWSSNDMQARFTTVGQLDYMLDKFYKGQYYPNGISAYALAEVVLQDAGVKEYILDDEMKAVTIFNPLPIDTHKACLQLIANACRAIMFENRDGKITIQTSILPAVKTINASEGMPYSSTKNLMTKNGVFNYATFEKDYFRLDGTQYFETEREMYLPSGFVSNSYDSLYDYNSYENKPQINGVELIGNRTTSDLLLDTPMTGATEITDGESGYTPQPLRGDGSKLLSGSGTWESPENTSDLKSDITATVTVGGVNAGDSFTEGTSDETVIRDIVSTVPRRTMLRSLRATPVLRDLSGYPYVEIKFDSSTTIDGLSLLFGDAIPMEIVVTDYLEDVLVDAYTITETSKTTTVTATFENVDTIRITFTATYPYQRVHLNKIQLSGALNYEISYHELKETPIATGIERVSNVNVRVFNYGKGEREEILMATNVVVGKNTLILYDDAYDYSVDYSDGTHGTLTILESYAHYLIVDASAEGEINVRGKKYMVSESLYRLHLHDDGNDKELKNELISNRGVARNVAAWLGEYFDNDIEYDVTYRGDPVIDCDDVIYLENKFVEKNLIRVTDETLNTSTGISLSCKLTGRRVSYVNKKSLVGIAVVGTAIVGQSEIT